MAEQSPREHEFFEKSLLRSFPLVVEDQKLWVSRELLAEHSPVFENMFFGAFREGQKDAEQVDLPEKRLDDVLEFLRVTISPEMKLITSKIPRWNIVSFS